MELPELLIVGDARAQLENRVSRGVTWLDNILPEWRDYIDWNQLDMHSPQDCVWGQVRDHIPYDLWCKSYDDDLGFEVLDVDMDPDLQFEILDELWRQYA